VIQIVLTHGAEHEADFSRLAAAPVQQALLLSADAFRHDDPALAPQNRHGILVSRHAVRDIHRLLNRNRAQKGCRALGHSPVKGLVEIPLQHSRQFPVEPGQLELKKAVDKGDRSVLHNIALPQAEEQPPGGHVPQLRIDPVGAPVQAGGNLRRIFEAGGHGEEQRGFPFGKQLLQDFDLDS